jgi:hypothetical protein
MRHKSGATGKVEKRNLLAGQYHVVVHASMKYNHL